MLAGMGMFSFSFVFHSRRCISTGSCSGCSSEPVVTQPSVTASPCPDATGMGLRDLSSQVQKGCVLPISGFILMRSSIKKCGGISVCPSRATVWYVQICQVRVERLGCGQCFTSLPAAHKFPPKTLSIY